jgi:hypothetical protein
MSSFLVYQPWTGLVERSTTVLITTPPFRTARLRQHRSSYTIMTSVFSSYSGGYGFNGFPSPLSPSFTGGNVTYGGRVPSQPTVSVGSHFGLQSQCASPVFSEASPYDASHFAYHPTSYDTHPQAAPSYPRDSTAGDIANFTAMTGVNPRMPSWDGASANSYTAGESVSGAPYWESPTSTTAPYPSTDLMPNPSWYCVQQVSMTGVTAIPY